MSKITAALVGCGDISNVWLKSIVAMAGVRLVALVDLDVSTAARQASRYKLHDLVVGSDLQRTLKQTNPDIVFDCTVPSAHANVTVAALRHGCHVLGEKPLADSLRSAHRMIDAADKADRYYAVMQNRRFNHNIRRLRRFVDSERIGKLTTLNSDFYIGAHMGGFRYHMDNVLLLDMAIHTFDAARFISGADPLSVYCKEWNPAGSWFDKDASAIAVFEMTGGLIYSYRGAWSGEGLRTSWESEWRLIGDRGSASWDGAESMRAEVATKFGANVKKYYAPVKKVVIPKGRRTKAPMGHPAMIQHFVDCVRDGVEPETICTDNVKSLAMVFAAIDSAKKGREVPVRW